MEISPKLTKKLISVGFDLTYVGFWPTEVFVFIVVKVVISIHMVIITIL
jgi:hypothetical protein